MKMSIYRQVARLFMTTQASVSHQARYISILYIYTSSWQMEAMHQALDRLASATLGDKVKHSCQPIWFCAREAGRGKAIATIGGVAAGDELTYAYVDMLQHVHARKSMLMALYRFEFKCAKCEREDNEQNVRRDVDIGNVGIYRELSF